MVYLCMWLLLLIYVNYCNGMLLFVVDIVVFVCVVGVEVVLDVVYGIG